MAKVDSGRLVRTLGCRSVSGSTHGDKNRRLGGNMKNLRGRVSSSWQLMWQSGNQE